MQELMSRHKAYALNPRDCLKTTLFQKWQKMVAPPGKINHTINGKPVCNTHVLEASKPANKRRKRKGSSAAASEISLKKGVSRPNFSLASQVTDISPWSLDHISCLFRTWWSWGSLRWWGATSVRRTRGWSRGWRTLSMTRWVSPSARGWRLVTRGPPTRAGHCPPGPAPAPRPSPRSWTSNSRHQTHNMRSDNQPVKHQCKESPMFQILRFGSNIQFVETWLF